MTKLLLGLLLLASSALADTPAPGVVAIKNGSSATQASVVLGRLQVDAATSPSGTQNTNITQILSAAPSASNYLPFRLTTGTSFYDGRDRNWALTFAGDKVDASGSSISVSNFPASFGVTQVTNPWVTSRNWSLTFVGDKADVSGSSVSVSNFPATQPVSGTVAVSNAFALDSTLSAFSAKFNSLGQKTMANSSPVVLASDQSSIPVTGSGNFTVVQPTGTNLHVVSDATSTTAVTQATAANLNATVVQSSGANLHVNVDSAPTTTVTGTVTANAGTNLNTSALQLDTTGAKLNNAQGSTTSGQTGPLVQGAVTTAAPTYTTAQTNPLSLTTAGALRTDSSATTQPVSGTVTANAGTGTFTISGTVTANAGTNLNTSALATSANQTTLGSQTTKLNDGTNTAAVKAASTAAVAADPALVVAISPNNTPVAPSGRASSQLIRNDYSTTNVTTAAYVQLVASTANVINRLWIFDSSGQDFVLATGAAASEVDRIRIPPGGWDSAIELNIPAGTRISIKASSATASSGILIVTGLQ